MLIIFYKISLIFAMMLIGYVCSKARLLPEGSDDYLIKLILNVTAPCMLVTSIAGKELDSNVFTATVQMLVGTVIYYIIAAFASIGMAKLMRIPKEDIGVCSMMLSAKNTGFMGFPVTKAAFGSDGLFLMVLSNIIMNVYIYSAGLIQVNVGRNNAKGAGEIKKKLKSMINMCSIAAIIGIILLFAGADLPTFIDDLISPIGDATIPISMIVLGVQLSHSNLRELIKNKRLWFITVVCQVIWPCLNFLAINWLPLLTEVKAMMIYASAFPTMVLLAAITYNEKLNTQFAAEGVAMTTLISVVTLPLATVLISMYYGM